MRHIYFATGNEYKFTEATERLADGCPEVELSRMPIDIPEIQSTDPDSILAQKVEYVRSKTNLPFIVDDASFDTDRYPGFPGSYAKFVNSTIGREGLKRLFDDGDSIRAMARIALCYMDEVYHFQGEINGELHFDGELPPSTNNILSDIMFIASGVSLGSALQSPDFTSHRGIAFSKLGTWLHAQNEREMAQKDDIQKRWSQRSAGWRDMIEDTNSYVNFEDNYDRVNAMIQKYGPMARGKALEIGCGTGEAGRILKRSNPALDVLSTDIADGMLHEAQNQTRNEGLDIHYRKADVVTDDLGEATYNIVLSRGVILSHLPKNDIIDYLESVTRHTETDGYFLFDFIQSVQIGNVEKPVDSKNEFTLDQLDKILGEIGWIRIDDDGTDTMRVRVACYQKREL